ncbi:MAG: magnesium transporter [Clostridia bacterium]|nr:magnesium transporter [Clostridia bacterium]
MNNENIVVSQHVDYTEDIQNIIRSNLTPTRIREKLLDYHDNDIALSLDALKREERIRLYSALDTDALVNIFEYVENIDEYLEEIGISKRVNILSHIDTATAVEYLGRLEKKDRDVILSFMSEEAKSEVLMLASFDKDEIGSRMTTNYISVRTGIGVRKVMSELVSQAAENDNVSTIYVLDESDRFVGAIDLKDLIIARADTPLDDIVMTTYPYVYASELIDDCIERIKGYSEDSIPVLDSDNRLRGVLTAQDIAELVEDEIGDDYAKLAGLSAEEDLHEPLIKSIGKRLPWLIVLFGLGMIVSSVVGFFEDVVANLAVIVSFQSLILGMAGNVGTQSLAVTIRSLSDESLTGRQKAYLVFKEARVGFFNGLILGSLSFGLIGAFLYFLNGTPANLAFSVSACTGVALFISMLLSSISGTAIPLLLKKLKIDPAVASGPFITTINDLVAVITYYGLAWLLLLTRL